MVWVARRGCMLWRRSKERENLLSTRRDDDGEYDYGAVKTAMRVLDERAGRPKL
jgi:hypothetical protein